MFLMPSTASPMMIPISRSPLAKIEVGFSTKYSILGQSCSGHLVGQPSDGATISI